MWISAILCSTWLSCARSREAPQPESRSVAIDRPQLVSADLCAQAVTELFEQTPLAGTPALDRHRFEILGRARAVPVVFARVPQFSDAGPRARELREELIASADPATTIFQILRRTRRQFDLRRDVFLREGYLYADDPHLALRLSQILRLDHLFDAEQVLVIRGAERKIAERLDGVYYWSLESDDRPAEEKNRRQRSEANFLLFDRVKAIESVPETQFGHTVSEDEMELHADFSRLKRQLFFDTVRIDHRTEDRFALTLTSAGIETQAIARISGGEARLECESIPPSLIDRVADARTRRAERQRLLAPILGAIGDMIERRLPFDEPRTEEGQQDGHLRIHFRKAFREGRSTYEFNGDRYFVFDGFGRPLLPQVCIDFITDALEWGTGGSWSERGEPRRHVRGALDFKSFGLENPRSVEQVAEFAVSQPEWFDMVFLEPEQRVKFVYRERFFQQLEKDRELYEPGDIVFILGLRDDERFHYHSFFIQEVDPISGAPTLLSANAGPPQMRTWEGEMSNAPLRSIVARLRLRTSLLRSAREQAQRAPGVPLRPKSPLPQRRDDPPSARSSPANSPELLPSDEVSEPYGGRGPGQVEW